MKKVERNEIIQILQYIKTINDECLEKLPKNINSQGSPRKEEIQQTSLHKRRKK